MTVGSQNFGAKNCHRCFHFHENVTYVAGKIKGVVAILEHPNCTIVAQITWATPSECVDKSAEDSLLDHK